MLVFDQDERWQTGRAGCWLIDDGRCSGDDDIGVLGLRLAEGFLNGDRQVGLGEQALERATCPSVALDYGDVEHIDNLQGDWLNNSRNRTERAP